MEYTLSRDPTKLTEICKKGMLYTFNWISGATNAEVAEETFLIEE